MPTIAWFWGKAVLADVSKHLGYAMLALSQLAIFQPWKAATLHAVEEDDNINEAPAYTWR